MDKVIDLPPTHKPPPVYEERYPSLPQKDLYQNGLNSRRFDYEDENPVGEDGLQQMYPLCNQMCYQDQSPGQHRSDDPERVYINPREHYV